MSEPQVDAVPEAALERLRDRLGADHVRTDDAHIAAHTRDTSLWLRTPAVVVYPGDTEEVAATVRVAAEFGLEVWPFSKGKNWGYGATMAWRNGAVIVVMERMNRILEVDEELGYAVIEPGVTQGQLGEHLRRNGIRMWADCTDSTPEGSVIGNALERGVGYTPYWDHFGHLCGLEVVLPDGQIVTTGGGGPESLTHHTYKWGAGPYVDGLFSQSNLGIVTRAGIWLMPEPEKFACFVCQVTDAADQPAVIDAVRTLALHRRLPGNVHVVNDILALAQVTQYPYDRTGGKGRLPAEVRAELQRRYRLTPWSVIGGLYGTTAQVRLARRDVQRALAPFGRVTYLDDRRMGLLGKVTGAWQRAAWLPGVSPVLTALTGSSLERLRVIASLYPILQGVAGEAIVGFAYFKSPSRPTADVDPGRDRAGLMWLAVLAPLTGAHTSALLALAEPIFEINGLDLSVAFIMVNERSTLGLFEIFYDRENPAECDAATAVHSQLLEATAAAHYQQYRASVADSDRITPDAAAYHRLVDSLKAAVDPRGTLAPGRYGVGRPDA